VKAMARKFWSWRGEKDAEGRALLQHVGSIGRDGWGADYWVEMLADAHETATVDYLIISDVRYLNEVRYVRAQGVLWIVTGRGGLLGEAGRHASEMAIDEIERNPADTEFINNCQMEVLADRVRQAVRDGRHDRDLM